MKRALSITSLTLCLAVFAATAPAALIPPQAQKPVYLPAGSVDVPALIDPPPEIGSPEIDAQMAIVLWLQHTRTPEQTAFVEQTLDVERFAPLLGDALMGVDGRALKQVIDDAVDQIRDDYDAHKGLYDLPRPFQINPEIEPPGTEIRPVSAYPSGHAIRAIVYARLLGEVFPEYEDQLVDLAHQIGYGRVIAGVHFPVDITSGQTLGQAYADAVAQQPAFQDAIQRLRGEPTASRVSEESPRPQ